MFWDVIRLVAILFLVLVAFAVLSAVVSFLIKIALILFLVAGAYYLVRRASRDGWERMFSRRDR